VSLQSGSATAWNPGANASVYSLAVSDHLVYAGGNFTSIGGQMRQRIAALSASINSNNATAWDPGADDRVSVLLAAGTSLYVGGRFYSIGGLPLRGFAVFTSLGDGEGDGDIDLSDYAIFGECLSGPGVSPGDACEDVLAGEQIGVDQASGHDISVRVRLLILARILRDSYERRRARLRVGRNWSMRSMADGSKYCSPQFRQTSAATSTDDPSRYRKDIGWRRTRRAPQTTHVRSGGSSLGLPTALGRDKEVENFLAGFARDFPLRVDERTCVTEALDDIEFLA
jgi:hypothetical protein